MPRLLRQDALDTVQPFLEQLKSKNIVFEICGSIRRQKPDIGDCDILVKSVNLESLDLDLTPYGEVRWSGKVKLSFFINGFSVDIKAVEQSNWGCGLLHHTGSKDFNIFCRSHAKRKGLSLNEYFLFKKEPDTLDLLGDPLTFKDVPVCDCSTERSVLMELFGNDKWLEPTSREFTGWVKKPKPAIDLTAVVQK